jgi:hypothetical protein
MKSASFKQGKPSFYDICIQNSFNSKKLQEIATTSSVPFSIIEAMCNGKPVERSHAEKVLVAFSKCTHRAWTLSNVNVPLTSAG